MFLYIQLSLFTPWYVAFSIKKFELLLLGKIKSNSKLKLFLTKLVKKESNIYWIHMASLGEFYQSKIIIDLLKLENPKNKIIASFSSPSGYQNFFSNSIDLSIYYLLIFLG